MNWVKSMYRLQENWWCCSKGISLIKTKPSDNLTTQSRCLTKHQCPQILAVLAALSTRQSSWLILNKSEVNLCLQHYQNSQLMDNRRRNKRKTITRRATPKIRGKSMLTSEEELYDLGRADQVSVKKTLMSLMISRYLTINSKNSITHHKCYTWEARIYR